MNTTIIEVAGIDMEVDFNYSPFVPGKYFGPWEDSYPDEPEEVEIQAVRCPAIIDGEKQWVDLFDCLAPHVLENLEVIIREAAGDYT